jgi:FkbH-like protein
LPRIVQLIGKTNQFNLTTRRYGAAELQQSIERGAEAFWARAEDRFGDYAIVGAAVVVPDAAGANDWRIDVFLLSCRALGRQIETAFLSALSQDLRARGARRLIAEYLPTAKNVVAANFYRDHGFQPQDKEGRLWSWDLTQGPVPPPAFISLEREAPHGGR